MSNLIFENNTPYSIDLSLATKIAKDLEAKEIELILTDNSEMHDINLTRRGVDKPTDVLSFPYEPMPNTPLGSIIISCEFVEKYSKQFKHSFEDEFNLLFIHALLHLLGFDHEVDNGEHRAKEQELIEKYKLPQSLIIRNS